MNEPKKKVDRGQEASQSEEAERKADIVERRRVEAARYAPEGGSDSQRPHPYLRLLPSSPEGEMDMDGSDQARSDQSLREHELEGEPDPFKTVTDVNLSEENREGDEMSGDDHSSGLQGIDLPQGEFEEGDERSSEEGR